MLEIGLTIAKSDCDENASLGKSAKEKNKPKRTGLALPRDQ
jgi:hypothetical protein